MGKIQHKLRCPKCGNERHFDMAVRTWIVVDLGENTTTAPSISTVMSDSDYYVNCNNTDCDWQGDIDEAARSYKQNHGVNNG